MRVQITLRGADAERFEEVREEMMDQRGLTLNNPDTVRELLAHFDPDDYDP